MKGIITRWFSNREYGLIESETGGREILVQLSEIRGEQEPREGQKVEYEMRRLYKAPRAINVKLIE